MPRRAAQFSFTTYPAADLAVRIGANEGDPIGPPEDAVPGDVYRLARHPAPARLAIFDGPDGAEVADGSEVGAPGQPLRLEACHSLMAPDGGVIDILTLLIAGAERDSRHVLPLSPLDPLGEYELVTSETDSAPRRFADIACVSFLAGTRLSLADGRQCPVEDLTVGDRLLTRDHGARPIRWIGQQTQRATGALAPVRITEGTLNVARDLRLSPHHRLFIWQRRDELGAGRAEVMIKADLLVNGDTVLREEGGFVDTFLILFDGHEIIYAEGVAVESLLVTGQTRASLPADLEIAASEDARLDAAGIEIEGAALNGSEDAAEKLSRASRGLRKT